MLTAKTWATLTAGAVLVSGMNYATVRQANHARKVADVTVCERALKNGESINVLAAQMVRNLEVAAATDSNPAARPQWKARIARVRTAQRPGFTC